MKDIAWFFGCLGLFVLCGVADAFLDKSHCLILWGGFTWIWIATDPPWSRLRIRANALEDAAAECEGIAESYKSYPADKQPDWWVAEECASMLYQMAEDTAEPTPERRTAGEGT